MTTVLAIRKTYEKMNCAASNRGLLDGSKKGESEQRRNSSFA